MALATAIVSLISTLAPIALKLFTGGISEEDARKQSAVAVADFAKTVRDSIAADAKKDAEVDAKLDELDRKFDSANLDEPTNPGK